VGRKDIVSLPRHQQVAIQQRTRANLKQSKLEARVINASKENVMRFENDHVHWASDESIDDDYAY